MNKGYIDTIAEGNVFQGWAWSSVSGDPRVVSIKIGDQRVARSVADHFREDLIAAGIGHGHYAFNAKAFLPLPAGSFSASLWDDEANICLSKGHEFSNTYPFRISSLPVPCEEIMTLPKSWSGDVLINHVESLRLDDQMNRMGVERFIDVLYMFLLDRPADPPGLRQYCDLIRSGKLSCSDVLRALVRSDEFKKMARRLPSPYESEYPFTEQAISEDKLHDDPGSATVEAKSRSRRKLIKKFRSIVGRRRV